jgi:polyisoprenoid-binding protein YceI
LNRLAAAAVAVLLVTAFGAQAADTYAIDSSHSSVGFAVKHMMISNVKGSFGNFEGTIVYDADNPAGSSVEFSLEVASIDTKNEKRDNHLRSDEFFDAANHPNITFKSSKVSMKGDKWVAAGDLTIRGVSKPVEIAFTINGPIQNPWGQTVIGFDITPLVVDRTEFGLNWNKALEAGGVVVGNDVTIDLQIEAAKQQG